MLRHAFGTTLFQREDANRGDWTFFTYEIAPHSNNALDLWLAAVLAKKQFGRLLRYVPSTYVHNEWGNCFLLLRGDGTGSAFINEQKLIFEWPQSELNVDICDRPPDEMIGLIKDIFVHSVNIQLNDPYLNPGDLDDRPIEFICGCREELERVTRWICHSEPEIFGSRSLIRVYINSSSEIDEEDREYFPAGIDSSANSFIGRMKPSMRIRMLLDLAFEYNNFTGVYWEYNDESRDQRSGYSRQPHDIEVLIFAPSGHERAEALLNLAEWLKGKVTEAERQMLLGSG